MMTGASTAALAAVAGCVASDDEAAADSASNGDDGGTGDGESDSPALRVVELSHPEPRVVSVDSEQLSGELYDFTVEIENTGTSGDVGATLVWMADQNGGT